MARSRSHKFRKLLVLVLLVVLALAFWPERVTIDPPADAPANARPDLPWNLTLVNRDSSLPEGYRLTLTHSRDGVKVDRRIAAELEQMLDAAEAQGFEVHLNAGYRTSAEQRALFDEKTASFQSTGYDEQTARTLAAQWVSPPGTSEHELGLAVDIGTETLALYDWLAAESWRYGFIQRYPPDKTALTGVSHEPWHYRFVGREAATEIMLRSLTLEEFLA